MAFGDWDFFNDGQGTQALDLSDPLVGNGSLRFQNGSTSNSDHHMTAMLKAASFTLGITKGRIRSLIQIEKGGHASIPNSDRLHFGVGCMRNLTGVEMSATGGGQLYIGGLAKNFVADEWEFGISRLTLGIPTSLDMIGGGGTGQTVVASGGTITLTDQDILPIQLEWILDIAQLGGIRLTLSRGNVNDLNFANLATVLDVVDPGALTTANAEGIWCNWGSGIGSGSSAGYRWDETSVFELL